MSIIGEAKEIDLEALRGHTAGPWEVGTKGNGAPGCVYCDNSLGSAVAIVYGAPLLHSVFSRAEEEANARLIAAAPDLLAELTTRRARDAEVEALVAACERFNVDDSDAAWDAFQAALAPFTGAKPMAAENDKPAPSRRDDLDEQDDVDLEAWLGDRP